MTLYNRICIALFGITAGIVVMFAADMVFNGGRFVAHTVHAKHPDCSGTCHGSTEQQAVTHPATRLALPLVRETHRSASVEARPWRGRLLGLSVETQGSD